MLEKWSISRLNEETGKDRRTIKKILSATAPAETTDKTEFYLLKDFISALESYCAGEGGNLEAEQTRLTKAKADIAEVERARIRNEVLETETVFRVWENVALSIRRTILTS